MRKLRIAAIAVVTAVSAVLPVSASAGAPIPSSSVDRVAGVGSQAAAAPGAQLAPGSCRHAWMFITANTIAIRSAPSNTAAVVAVVQADAGTVIGPWPCRHFVVGGGYTACGAANTGWVLVPRLAVYPQQGWIQNQCTVDPDLS